MRQLIYISTVARDAVPMHSGQILKKSQDNNARDGVTGLLYFDGKRFLQVLEGDAAAVARTYGRIKRDPRHRAVVILSDRAVETRDFGDWSMAWKEPGADAADFIDRVARLVDLASPSVRATFNSFAEVRRAA